MQCFCDGEIIDVHSINVLPLKIIPSFIIFKLSHVIDYSGETDGRTDIDRVNI